MIRLDKYIADMTDMSRALAKKAINKGRVSIGDAIVRKSETKIEETANVLLDGTSIRYQKNLYIALNKPIGYVCSTRDPDNPTILELLPDTYAKKELHAAGRLDIDTTGLVLLTDDGKWSHEITSPRRKKVKIYEVETELEIDENNIQKFEGGLYLEGDDKVTLPAKLAIVGKNRARLELIEGRFHQVKRMFEAVGNKVIRLHRSQIAGMRLPVELEEGAFIELSYDEAQSLISQ